MLKPARNDVICVGHSSTRVQRSQSKLLLERVTWVEKRRAIIVECIMLRLQFTWNLEPASATSCKGMTVSLSAALALYFRSSRYKALELLPGTPDGVAITSVGEYATITDHGPKVEGRGARR